MNENPLNSERPVHRLVSAIAAADDEVAELIAGDLEWLVHALDEEVQPLLDELAAHIGDRHSGDRHGGKSGVGNERLLAAVLRRLVERAYAGGPHAWKKLNDASRASVTRLYEQLGPDSTSRHSLLQLMAVSHSPQDLTAFAQLVASDPPQDATSAAVAFGPLFQNRDYDAACLFPQLFDALANPSLAPLVMDLSNYVTREQIVAEHPATARHGQLVALLGSLIQRLGVMEEQPDSVTADSQELSNLVSQCVSLVVALCDALGLIGNPAAIGKLNQVLELRHRRLRTEAAAALAKLGDENGQQVLVSLAAEPVARLRVLAYAEELGLEDRIEERFATPAARAEAELACWLAQPTQLGFPPSRLELVDSQTLYWPGYDEPVECFLIRFSYEAGDREYSNIGIAGPVCHAFAADLADLPPSEIYALFAGWQAEHDDIVEYDAAQLTQSQRVEVARLERRLRDDGCDSIRPVTLGVFFGEKVLVARATREGQAGVGVATNDTVQWMPTARHRRPLGPREAYCLFKGRHLLRAFNP